MTNSNTLHRPSFLQVVLDNKIMVFETVPTSSVKSYLGYEVQIDGYWVGVEDISKDKLKHTFSNIRRTFSGADRVGAF